MGAISGRGSFVDTDWRNGIRKVQIGASEMFGYQEGYSGAENSCDFCYKGEYIDFGKNTKKAEKDLNTFIHKRLEKLGAGDGEIINVGQDGVLICSTVFKEVKYRAPFDRYHYLRNMKKGPSVLLEKPMYGANDFVIPVEEGTVALLKEYAHTLLRESKYSEDYYILTKNKLYLCTGDCEKKKKTTRVTTDKYLVLPIYKFIYYGWYRE